MTRLKNLREGMEFVFERGTLTLGLKADSSPRLDGQPVVMDGSYATTIAGAFRCFWTSFLRGLEEHVPNDTSAYRSLPTTEWVAGIYEAMQRPSAPTVRLAAAGL